MQNNQHGLLGLRVSPVEWDTFAGSLGFPSATVRTSNSYLVPDFKPPNVWLVSPFTVSDRLWPQKLELILTEYMTVAALAGGFH